MAKAKAKAKAKYEELEILEKISGISMQIKEDPLAVKPRILWLEERIRDIVKAIGAHRNQMVIENDTLGPLVDELSKMLSERGYKPFASFEPE